MSQIVDSITHKKGEITIQLPYLPNIKPPVIDKGFYEKFKGDIAIISESPPTYPLVAGSVTAGLSLGANDFANAMGTSIGSGAVTLGTARALGGAAVLYGATFGGKETAGTIKKGIWDLSQTTLDAGEAQLGMSLALIGASLWVGYATYRGLPVSTSQSTVGGLIGVGTVAEAFKQNDFDKIGKGVQFGKIGNIAKSWVISPLAGGFGSAVIYSLIARPLYKYTQYNPLANVLWKGALVSTGTYVAYSLGRNDAANFIGPLAGGIDAAKNGEDGQLAKSAEVSQC